MQPYRLFHAAVPTSIYGLSIASNLVQFKPGAQITPGISPSSFTFQSGTIQANGREHWHKQVWSFTFQSGTIQAGEPEPEPHICVKLYIPIWYNSSVQKLDSDSKLIDLYIPIWYNSSPPNCGVLFPMFSTPVSVYHDHIVNKNPFPVPFPNHRKRIFIGVFNPCRPRCIFTLS